MLSSISRQVPRVLRRPLACSLQARCFASEGDGAPSVNLTFGAPTEVVHSFWRLFNTTTFKFYTWLYPVLLYKLSIIFSVHLVYQYYIRIVLLTIVNLAKKLCTGPKFHFCLSILQCRYFEQGRDFTFIIAVSLNASSYGQKKGQKSRNSWQWLLAFKLTISMSMFMVDLRVKPTTNVAMVPIIVTSS